MRKLTYFSLLFVLTIVFLDSCTIVKRRFNPGYSISWNSKFKPNKTYNEIELASKKVNSSNIENEIEINPSISTNYDDSEEMIVSNAINSYAQYNEVDIRDNNKTIENSNLVKKSNHKVISESYTVNTTKKVIDEEKLTPLKIAKNKVKQKSKGGDTEKIIGLILCFIGLAPFGVRYAKGKNNSAYKTNLMIWLAGLICFILGIIVTIIIASGGGISFLGLALYGIGALCLFIAFIHGLISILR